MFRTMRRFRQQLPPGECEAILRRGSSGVLAVAGDGAYPYAVPLSYVYFDGQVWFHCAPAGHKLDAVRREERASFCVIDLDRVIPEKLTSAYRSVIVFGRVSVVEGGEAALQAIRRLGEKYDPDGLADLEKEIEGAAGRMVMLCLDVEHMTGKQGIELVRETQNK